VEDTRAVEDAARRFLLVLYTDEDISPYLVDRLDWMAPEPGERLGTGSVDVEIRRLEVVRLEHGAATVEAVAHFRHVQEHPVHGSVPSTIDFDGVIELERVDAGWRVADYVNHGRRLSDVLRPPDVLELGKLAISVPALNLAPRWTYLALAVENRGAHLVVLSYLYRGARAFGLWHYVGVPFGGVVEVPAGSRVVTSSSWLERLPVRTRELRFLLLAGEADGPERFELAFSVRRAPEQRLVALDRPPLLYRLPRRVVRYVRLAPVALFVALILLHQLRAGGVLFALYGVGFGAALAVWSSRGRPVRGLVGPALATFAVGVWLAWTRGSIV
jgi:hypothetical protein